jgi:hypothetical protein
MNRRPLSCSPRRDLRTPNAACGSAYPCEESRRRVQLVGDRRTPCDTQEGVNALAGAGVPVWIQWRDHTAGGFEFAIPAASIRNAVLQSKGALLASRERPWQRGWLRWSSGQPFRDQDEAALFVIDAGGAKAGEDTWPRRGVEPVGEMMARTLRKARQPGRMISRTTMVS